MTIHLVSISSKPPSWVSKACEQYLTRCPGTWSVRDHTIALQKRQGGCAQAAQKEAKLLKKLLNHDEICGAYLIGLDPNGRQLDSIQFAKRLQRHLDDARQPILLIGPPDGLDPQLKALCHEFWSLGQLTIAHTLAKVVVAEQIFRAWSIIHQHPYHRE